MFSQLVMVRILTVSHYHGLSFHSQSGQGSSDSLSGQGSFHSEKSDHD